MISAASLSVSWNPNSESDLAGYKVYYGTQQGTYGAGVDVGNTTSYQINNVATGTTYYVALTAYDTSNNESAKSEEVSVYVPVPDTTPPTGTIKINSGALITASRAVTLTLTASDAGGSVVSMKISNDGVTWSGEGAFAATQSWALTEGDGLKTVYVNFKDAAGNWMATPVTASITLSLDSDGDGLKDSWEITYGLDPYNPTDAALDKDGDGFSNFEEYYNGTNPSSAADCIAVAEAGANQQVAPTRVYLDGSGSRDPRGLTLQYAWSFVSGPATVTIDDANTVRASFVGTKAGVYRMRLTCSNGRVSVSDTVDITILNVKPTVNAGNDMTVDSGTQLTLHATGADSNEDLLSYQWSLVQGTGVTLPDMSQQDITLSITNAGQYKFSVVCSDGFLSSVADEVIVTVNAANHAPTANAGADQNVTAGQQVVLSGTGSADPDNDTLSYFWRQVSGTQVTLSNAATASAYFTPSAPGTYVFELTVSDGKVSSVPDSVSITAVKLNTAPVADAGDDASTMVGSLVTLDASGSYDPDGDALTYSWIQTSGASVTLANSKAAQPTFTPTTSGVLGFKVSVSDGQITTEDAVLITVDDVNQVPVAEAGQDQTVTTGSTVVLNGSSSSDPDNDPISYIWSQTSGTRVSLAGSNTVSPSFVATEAGVYVFELKVYDGTDTSTADTVTVTVQASAVAISLLTPQVGEVVSSNPTLSWSAKGMIKYRVYITLDGKKYSNVYSGSATSCRMHSTLWNWFIASGTTVYWYVQGTGTDGKTYKSAMSNFKKR